MEKIISLEDLGYDDFFESGRKKLESDNSLEVARVTAEHRGAYTVKNADGEYLGKITGKKMFAASLSEDYPAVGDWVLISIPDEKHAVIHAILPRKTTIRRRRGDDEIQVIAANVDVAFVAQAFGRDYNLNRFERYFAIAKDGGVKPVMVLNKTDLISKEELESVKTEIKKRFANVDFIFTSTARDGGLDELSAYMEKRKTYCFLGSSGVGKSTIINGLLGKNLIKINDISSYSERGKHTTTRREMYFLENGGIVIDNPGMREVGLTDMFSGIDDSFDEITNLAEKCKYTDCKHVKEAGCAVLSELESGVLDRNKYLNYLNLRKEAAYYEMNKLERREKDRKFGKFIKKAKERLKKTTAK